MLELVTLLLASDAAASAADPRPNSITVAEDTFEDWKGEVRTHIDWHAREPFLEEAECKLTNGSLSVTFAISPRYGEQPMPVVWIDTSEMAAAEELEHVDLTEVTIGSRVFQLDRPSWRAGGWFIGYGYRGSTIDVSGPSWFVAAREAPDDPWLPLGVLLPTMMKARRIEVYYRPDESEDRATNEEASGKVRYDMSGLSEATSWCLDTLDSDVIKQLPDYILEQSPVLDEDELRALLSDVVASRQIPGGAIVGHPAYEIFHSDGRYQRQMLGMRGQPVEGTFRVLHWGVCTRVNDGFDECRKIIRNPDGTYTFEYIDEDRSEIVTITAR